MLRTNEQTPGLHELRFTGDGEAFEVIEGDMESGLLLICDHAANRMPPEFGNLGLGSGELGRHIAYDIGVESVTRSLARLLGVPAVMSCFSRLLIDPNRGADDPTLVMRISDGHVVPGNAAVDDAEVERRLARFYRPYDNAVAAAIEAFQVRGINPALLSIHSFTPQWKGIPRPWHAGVLYDRDLRFVEPLLEALLTDEGVVVGRNEPYSGELEGDTMNRHGTKGGLAHALLEIRQDLITEPAGQEEWAQRLAKLLPALIESESLHEIAMQ